MAIRFFQSLAAVGVLGVSCAAGFGSELCPVETGLVGVHDTIGRGYAVHVEGDRLYVGTGIDVGDGVEFGGVEIVDVSEPGMPVLLSRVDVLGDVFGVDVAGDLMFVAGGDAGVLVFDIADEMNPFFVGGLQVGDTAVAVDAGDGVGVIYVAALKSGLLVVDVSVPGSLALMGSYVAEDWIAGLAVDGDVVYAAGGTSGVHAVDVGDPMNPVAIGVLDTAGFVSDVVVEDRVDGEVVGRVVYAADFGSLLVVDVDEPGMMSVVGSVVTPGQAQGVAVGTLNDGIESCSVVYVSDGGSGVQVVGVGDGTEPEILGNFPTSGVFDVAVGDGAGGDGDGLGLVYLAASRGGAIAVESVLVCSDCPADLNLDGMLDFFDVSAFLSAFGAGDAAADFSGDGVFDFFDVSAFLMAFSAGCP